jgi:hypothetical protein
VRPAAEEPRSARSLEAVGVETVLGAMIEQKRRASQPSFVSPVLELAADDLDADDLDKEGTMPGLGHEHELGSHRAPTTSEVFLKAR